MAPFFGPSMPIPAMEYDTKEFWKTVENTSYGPALQPVWGLSFCSRSRVPRVSIAKV